MTEMETLFEEWKQSDLHTGKRFIEDGIVDIDRWKESKFNVLFLLKEAYETENWDKSQWLTIAHWAYGLRKLYETGDVVFFPGEKMEERDKMLELKEASEAFLSSALVNIKKSCGDPSSDNDDLMKYVKEDWGRILRQVKLINPDIIICGSTWWGIIKKHLDDTDLKYEKISEWVYKYEELTFVDFWHPANQYPNKLNYYALCTAVRLSGVLTRLK